MDVIGPFFETHVLGIMALLADTINDGKGPQPLLEKMRCLGAIREMIKLAKSHVTNGLPQVQLCNHLDVNRAKSYCRYVRVYDPPLKTKSFLMKVLTPGLS